MSEVWEVKYKIIQKHGHYEVYANNEFICSADTAVEAAKELEKYKEQVRAGVA